MPAGDVLAGIAAALGPGSASHELVAIEARKVAQAVRDLPVGEVPVRLTHAEEEAEQAARACMCSAPAAGTRDEILEPDLLEALVGIIGF
jgi:hypothetical protein